MSEIILETKNLTKVYGTLKVVKQLNITAYEGEIFGFLGPNGAGKTTTLGMILGLVHATAGEITVCGQPVRPNRVAALKQVGALLGAPAFVPYLSAWQNVELVSRLTPGIRKKEIDDVLELVGLTSAARRRVGKFSTGMKQRVGLAMALIHKPRLVILDEPTNGLDPAGMRDIRTLIRTLADNGTSVLLSSHLLNEVQQVCDRIAVINKGSLVTQGRVDALLKDQKPAVLLKVNHPVDVIPVLRSINGVVDVHPNGNDHLVVEGVGSQIVMEHLMQAGIVPLEITNKKTDLESLFMDITEA